jgi:L-alanine-DL-glutamate epimerase-like enolase superfamily enzyme
MKLPGIKEIAEVRLYFLPVQTRVPLKFGTEVLNSVTCARACVTLTDDQGRVVQGWGETPLSVQWVWPGTLPYETRHHALKELCKAMAREWLACGLEGHPLWVGHNFIEHHLPQVLKTANASRSEEHAIPLLAALLCTAPFDVALHDAYGKLTGLPVYRTYGEGFMEQDLSAFLEPSGAFQCRFPSDYLSQEPSNPLPAWHLVGGLDPLTTEELTGTEPQDGYPITLQEWIRRDGLRFLKVKLRGNDAAWDYARLVAVGRIAMEMQAKDLSADFNCTVQEPQYVCEILDRLAEEEPRISDMLLYVEQPFPYELEPALLDVRSVSKRKPLFLDESAHNWRMVRLGRELGWTGVALKTCKTQTGAILSACWARQHEMNLMVQDLTNPMIAQIPHVLLAAHTGTIAGVETNSMQFYPEASSFEARIHPGLYRRRNGAVELSTIQGPGFGYRMEEINRPLPAPVSLAPESTP